MFHSLTSLFGLLPPLTLQSFNVIRDHLMHSSMHGVLGAHFTFKAPHLPPSHRTSTPSSFPLPKSTTIVSYPPGLPHYSSTLLCQAPHSLHFLFIFINNTPRMPSLQPLICSPFSPFLVLFEVSGPLMAHVLMIIDLQHLLLCVPNLSS